MIAKLALKRRSLGQEDFSAHTDGLGGGTGQRGGAASSVPRFGLLGLSEEERKRRRLVMGFTPIVEAAAVAVMLWALMSLPPTPVVSIAKHEVVYFHPVSPEVVKHPPQLLKQPVLPKQAVLPKLQRQEVQQPPETARLKMPEISQPKIELPRTPQPPAPRPAPKLNNFSSPEVSRPATRQPAMPRVGAFNPGSMAKATVKRPLNEVQTGGFGAENGIPNDPSADSHNHIAQLGSFDLPSGPGQGNGTGGAHGVRGTVGSAGFGNGIGSGTGARPGGDTATVQQGGFGSVVAGKAAKPQATDQTAAAFKPVVILSKPDPVYPPEARRLHIEGEVVLSVLFGSSGNLRVLKVEQGLGHGMDQAAVEAAERIRFKPAERDGRPVDSTAMVHIIFQLAY